MASQNQNEKITPFNEPLDMPPFAELNLKISRQIIMPNIAPYTA